MAAEVLDIGVFDRKILGGNGFDRDFSEDPPTPRGGGTFSHVKWFDRKIALPPINLDGGIPMEVHQQTFDKETAQHPMLSGTRKYTSRWDSHSKNMHSIISP